MVCPSCGSEDIDVYLDEDTGIAVFEYCNNCGNEDKTIEMRHRRAQKKGPLKFKLGFAP